MQSTKSNGRIWHRIRIIAVLPAAFVLWMIGWTLYYFGEPKQSAQDSVEQTEYILKQNTP
jgi:hypothetical protein